MVVNRKYLHHKSVFDKTYVFKSVISTTSGQFKDPIGNLSYDFAFSSMSEAPEAKLKAKPEFKIDNEIEVSFNSSFDDRSGTFKGKFKHLDPSGSYWVVDKDGFMRCGDFARKVEPMVVIYDREEELKPTRSHTIPKSLMDKIIAGDFNV